MFDSRIVVVDDLTGKEIKEGGWCFMRLSDGKLIHTQNYVDMIELLLEGREGERNPFPFGDGFARGELEASGIIGPVLSEQEKKILFTEEEACNADLRNEDDCCNNISPDYSPPCLCR